MTLGFLTTPMLGLTSTAVVGHMGDPEALAGLAIGAMLFDLILGSFNFLRASTTGLTAQAYGRRDQHEQQAVFARALISALGCGLALLCLSPLLEVAGLRLMGAEGAIAEATATYFSIRILAAPAALANYAILGFVLGRGRGGVGLLLQALINGINILLSIYLGLSLDWGVAGVAWGTLAGEVAGTLTGLFIVLGGFAKSERPAWPEVFSRHRLAELFALNRDILIRTFVLIGAFAIMTRIGTGFGAVTLAANAVLMNFFLLSGYYLDGLANAAEQITGRAVGARYRPAFDRGLKLTILWSFGLAGDRFRLLLPRRSLVDLGADNLTRGAAGGSDLSALGGGDWTDRGARLPDGWGLHRRDMVGRHAQPDADVLCRLPRHARRLRAALRQSRPVAWYECLPAVARLLPRDAGQAAGRSDFSGRPVIEPGVAQVANRAGLFAIQQPGEAANDIARQTGTFIHHAGIELKEVGARP